MKALVGVSCDNYPGLRLTETAFFSVAGATVAMDCQVETFMTAYASFLRPSISITVALVFIVSVRFFVLSSVVPEGGSVRKGKGV